MNTDLLYAMLDVDPGDGPAELLLRARDSRQLPYLILSSLAREGTRMGEPARAELRRAQDRADLYAQLAVTLGESTGVRPIGGARIAGYYPANLLRPQNDLNLVAPTEAALWQAVARLVCDHPVEDIEVTLLGDRPRHTAVTVCWPAADPLLDPWHKVRLCTAALLGDLTTVPVRPLLAAEDHVECLIALAEQGLRRTFRVRDAVDVQFLSELTWDPGETAAVLAAYRLAPEAAQLLDFTVAHAALGPLAAVRTALEPEIAPELRRRVQAGTTRAIVPRHGVFLRRTVTRDSWDQARLVPFDHGELLMTPVADYLLPGQDAVTWEQQETALAALHAWDTGRRYAASP